MRRWRPPMNKAMLNGTTACAALALALALVPATAQESGRTRVGTLTCNISPGVGMIVAGQRQLSCIYASARGRAREAYEGTFSTLGLDIGATSGGQLTWAVFAPTTLRRAALAGTYAGATAGGTVGAGASANVLGGGGGREHCGGRIQNGPAAGHCAPTSQGPVMTSSPVN